MSIFTDIWNGLRSFYEARHEPENMRPLAEWYWRTLLLVALVALIGILMYGAWEFLAVARKLGAGTTSRRSEQPEILTRKDLADTLGAYSARQAEFDLAKQSRTTVPDPSR